MCDDKVILKVKNNEISFDSDFVFDIKFIDCGIYNTISIDTEMSFKTGVYGTRQFYNQQTRKYKTHV